MLRIMNPATEQLIDELDVDTPESVAENSMRQKQLMEWAGRPLEDRMAVIERFAKIILNAKRFFGKNLKFRNGKTCGAGTGRDLGVGPRVAYFYAQVPPFLDS